PRGQSCYQPLAGSSNQPAHRPPRRRDSRAKRAVCQHTASPRGARRPARPRNPRADPTSGGRRGLLPLAD
nr:hypothetical protein [Tanacetum cinerariifolium]